MRFYQLPDAPIGRRWHRTQDEAKAEARQHPSIIVTHNVDVTHPALVGFFNAIEHQAVEAVKPAGPAPPPTPTEAAAPVSPPAIDMNEIERILLDVASQAQIERLFACLGARFGEAIRPRRVA